MKPERDALRCAVSDCSDEPSHATPAGPLCEEHAAEFADLEGGRYSDQMEDIDGGTGA